LNLIYTGRFKKDFKLLKKRNVDEDMLRNIIEKLLNGKPLPAKHRDHALIGKFSGSRECHIEPDWLLIYLIRKDDLILERTGSHADLFK